MLIQNNLGRRKKNWSGKKFCRKKNLGLKTKLVLIWVGKKIGSEKNFGSENEYGSENKFGSEKKFGRGKNLSQGQNLVGK